MVLPAAAQDLATATATATIIITGSGAGQRAFDTPFSLGVVDAEALRGAGPMVNLSEALARVPGLVVKLRNNYAQDLQISSRGYGARASFGVRGVRLYSDGIPAAGPDGQGQVSHFDLAGAERVEVLRGPFSALYGSSSGGVIALVSKAPTANGVQLAADAGSDGLRQARLGVAAVWGGGFSLRAGLSTFEVDGFRPQSHARRTLGNLRLGWEGEADRVVLILNAIDQPAQDPLGLTREQFEANPDQTTPQATQFNTRKQQAQQQAGLQWQHRFADAGPLQRAALALYGGRREVTQWQSIPPATQANPLHPGGVIDFDRDYGGVDLRLHWHWNGLRVVTGAATDGQHEDRRGFENFSGSGATQQLGVTGRLRRFEDNRARGRDLYAQAELDLPAALSASAGLRRGRLRISSADHFLANGDDSGALRFGSTTPMAALRWQPGDDWSLYASTGRGWERATGWCPKSCTSPGRRCCWTGGSSGTW
jgi:iron complex outermembrane receptor protein